MSLMTSLGIDPLPADEQLRLVGEILDVLPGHALTDAQRRELDRRLARLDLEGAAQPGEDAVSLTEGQQQVFQRRMAEFRANPSIGLTW